MLFLTLRKKNKYQISIRILGKIFMQMSVTIIFFYEPNCILVQQSQYNVVLYNGYVIHCHKSKQNRLFLIINNQTISDINNCKLSSYKMTFLVDSFTVTRQHDKAINGPFNLYLNPDPDKIVCMYLLIVFITFISLYLGPICLLYFKANAPMS